MKKIIVTGGAGFIGSHIADALIREGYEVHIIDNMFSGKKENVNSKAILHKKDIRNLKDLIPLFRGAEYVFHLAALPQVEYSIRNPIETSGVNVLGILNVLEACRINKVKRLIFSSSCAVYGDQKKMPIDEKREVSPLSPYATHKYIGEIFCKLYSQIYEVETVSLRYFNVYGPRQSIDGAYPSVIAKFIDLKKKNKKLTVTGDGRQTRSYVNVLDVVSANLKVMKSRNVGNGEVINIGTGEMHSVLEIARIIGGEITFIEKRIEPRAVKADIKKAKKLLNWKPKIKLENGIKELY